MRASLFMLSIAVAAGTAQGAIQKMGEVSPCVVNLLESMPAVKVTSTSELAVGCDPQSVVDPLGHPGPAKDGTIVFADKPQKEVLTIDLRTVLDSGMVVIRTHPGDGPVHGDADHRRPKVMTILASPDGADGSFKMLQAWTETGSVPRRQSVAWDQQPVRYLRIDLGFNDDGIGSRLADVALFPLHHLPSLGERLADLDQLLRSDLPELATYRQARQAGDHRAAVDALRVHFGRKPVEIGVPKDKHAQYAEDWMHNVVRFDEHRWQIPGHRFDWQFMPCDLSDEPPSYWVAGSLFWFLPDYYHDHRDARYARQACRMIRDWMTQVPCPGVHKVPTRRGPTMVGGWPAIRTANRAGGLTRALALFAPCRREFDDETWVHVLYAVWEHASFLAQVSPELGGNWLTWANERLILIARDFPEFCDQRHWLEAGRQTYETAVRRDVTESGKEREDSTYYCLRAMHEILHTYTVFTDAGVALPADVRARVGRALEFPAWVHQPGFRNPGIGDMGTVYNPVEHLPLVHEYATKWKREDLRYIDSRGQQGTRPEQTSRAFLPDGWFVMRSAWEDGLDARHLLFRAPPGNCRGHGHQDVLGLVLYAYGRPLLIDPGMTLYGTKGSEQYAATAMHNVVTIDGRSQPHGAGKINAWKSTDLYDLADAEHALYPGIVHRRRVVFVKPVYFVVVDSFAGAGAHRIEWNYHFLTGAAPIEQDGVIRTRFSSQGNLAIVLPGAPNPTSAAKPFSYVTDAREGGQEIPSVGWRLAVDARLPQQFVTLLFPYSGRDLPVPFGVKSMGPDEIEVHAGRLKHRVNWKNNETIVVLDLGGNDS